ncbi:DUF3558 domain-containing protein [Nocardia pseudobrasiliensis]|uniref:Uncharacterized protein DUF3558 n=1 Tax=Nocardia pseudobrasiliensis TaxID=45979 RepID=A0A370I141_9NOCA|nr:DUF3558 domain-containing protein [Nocardia pseudobrasiliensis]RDI64436.1 uncharacterized protein DUF3558 [Nocardia pseudobrasiliensis]
MVGATNLVRGVVLVTGIVAVATGCGPDGGGQPTPSASSTALPPAPKGFDPCSDIPQSVLDSEQLHSKDIADSNGNGGTQWRGCGWVQSDGYAVSIRTTNITVQMVRDNKAFQLAEELTIAGRQAVTYHDPDSSKQTRDCLLNVELKGGSVEFSLINPASNRKTGTMDTCELAKTLAGKVVPLIPASA